ncbi:MULTISPECIES: lmo0937 family membrane protein [Geomicrobium]|uniref:Membrane metal-binding protein n=1 Tax=Geomicrobium sediminis TaxID=1347788 RepID=A0ABS2PGL6_9BACL|nr:MULTISPECIES: lmo0937 family membrane protein [Geomicrobium]MBM7634578.1 putative membrane metal-binding protein [Geomicrobium sediminis]
MLWTIILVIIVLWLLGFIADVAGNLIHILLVVALVIFIFQLLTGRR